MWKWILQAAVAIGQSEWARTQLTRLIDKVLNKAEKKARDLEHKAAQVELAAAQKVVDLKKAVEG